MKLKQQINKWFVKSSFVRNVLTLMTGTSLAYGMTAIAEPFIARIYTPDAYGIFAVYFSIVSILSIGVCWRYELAIVLPETEEDSINVLILSLGLALITSLIFALIFFLFSQPLSELFGINNLYVLIIIIPISIFITGFYQCISYWLTKTKDFKNLSFFKFLKVFLIIFLQILFGFFYKDNNLGLIIAYTLSLGLANLFLGVRVYNKIKFKMVRCLSYQRMFTLMNRYRKYPIYSILPSFLNTSTLRMPVFFLSTFFTASVAGQYSLSMRLLLLPSALVIAEISKVNHQKFVEDKYNKRLSNSMIKAFWLLFCISISGGILIFIFASFIFTSLFGSQWETAAIYTKVLAPSLILRMIVSPLSIVFGIMDRQEVAAGWQIASNITTIAFLGLSLQFNDPLISLYLLCLNDLIMYTIYLLLIFRISHVKLSKLFSLNFLS
ncbi:O-antigen translocase [Crocosphaera watsonii WH 0003]|uniref:O-antigen translocase n=3 Tax=Crocosphaera watsonii TaxID=263511 RepID=G5J7S1_CROWT|nr:O-antigen translocase [Crocosphaera watsonii WH 0003]